MKTIINFYLALEENEDLYADFENGIETDNPMYLTLQAGDTIISPKEEKTEYVVDKIVKNFYDEKLEVYISRTKSNTEILDEIGVIANKTLQTMLDSFKDVFGELDKNEDTDQSVDKKIHNLKIIDYIKDNKEK
ncbi:hypothetical protein [Clostridium sp. DJ247]|uniref:hypothetical protein n=1 Tax=Clostridium sp. DJ247 TaxID=2726188 RepID=UPI0016235CC1|nr:hypothetical protein [Clostridium sp. DJ247]MBC2581385.1 hypothetical protein [Clostridium sp. DJ247]